jgi:hypothetical protein
MPVDHIRYDILAQEALRDVVRKVMIDAAKKGLPGEHHFFITFDTKADNVKLSPRLREQYPEEMTVVLQHQFWDLKVTDVLFEVGLSFSGVMERLVVPFDAIKSFVDPSVQFGLQFEEIAQDGDEAAASPAAKKKSDKSEKPTELPKAKPRTPALPAAAIPATAEPAAETDDDDKPTGQGGAEVVRLDRFRKK